MAEGCASHASEVHDSSCCGDCFGGVFILFERGILCGYIFGVVALGESVGVWIDAELS